VNSGNTEFTINNKKYKEKCNSLIQLLNLVISNNNVTSFEGFYFHSIEIMFLFLRSFNKLNIIQLIKND